MSSTVKLRRLGQLSCLPAPVRNCPRHNRALINGLLKAGNGLEVTPASPFLVNELLQVAR